MSLQRREVPILRLVHTLDNLGFYHFTPEYDRQRVKKKTVSTCRIFDWPETRRVYNADAERLAEGYAYAFLEQLQPFLELLGVKLTVIEQVFEQGKEYALKLNGRFYAIYPIGVAIEPDLVLMRVAGLIDHLLILAGSQEHTYLLYKGNDSRLVFLTSPMRQCIAHSGLFLEQEIPRPVVPYE